MRALDLFSADRLQPAAYAPAMMAFAMSSTTKAKTTTKTV
ncbi:hypothetical protein GGQ71_003298 [Rhizobium taibaishanense]|uniref:Uncharacterized protein n=1 Tax=Allorhizobium taibaishanense TaxID=887144 RepID=A0A7W6HQA5_9HYPH|nr:hypothetical protein [Allorhizobium taibaishanense]